MTLTTIPSSPLLATASSPGAMSAAQAVAVNAIIPATESADVIVLDGDSLTAGLDWPSYLPALLTDRPYVHHVTAVGGRMIPAMTDAAPLSVDPLFSARARHNILCIWSDGNDMCTYPWDVTPAVAYDRLAAYCRLRRQRGWETLVGTMISRAGSTSGGVAHDILAVEFNALIRRGFASGELQCDGIVDYALQAHLGGIGDYANTTYFPDGVHACLSGPGATIIASTLAAAIIAHRSSVASSGANVALGKTYTVSKAANSSPFDDAGGIELTDGVINAYMYGGHEASVGFAAAAGGSPPLEIVIDLGVVRGVYRVRAHAGSYNNGTDALLPATMTVQTSPDNSTFTTRGTWTNPGGATAPQSDAWMEVYLNAPSVRYIKVIMPFRQPGAWIMLGEVEAYGY